MALLSIELAVVVVIFPIYALLLFTKTFLHTIQYPKINKLLNLALIITPLYVVFYLFTGMLDEIRLFVILSLFLYLMFITIYAAIKRNRQAYFILFGWTMILIAISFMSLSSSGVFDVYSYFPYIVEVALILEVLIFSFALADRIKVLQSEKENAQYRLIKQQKNEKKHLKELVEERTKELKELNKNLEQRVKEGIKQAEQMQIKLFESERMAAMGEMFGNIAHQWRQPLSMITSISSGIQVKKEYEMLDDEFLNKSMDDISDMTGYLSQTIDDFRDYIKGEMRLTKFKLSITIDKLLNITRASLKSKQIEIILELEDDIFLENYENALIQSLINIINNAKDALAEVKKEDQRFLFIKTFTKDEKIFISIKDSAGGIEDKVISKIFQAYFTTKDENHGTGLGLHMTYNMIKTTMNGDIYVHNVPFKYKDKEFKGAEFIITFKP
jgi:signal transduction histidine kinase